jgi:hypothetical protein
MGDRAARAIAHEPVLWAPHRMERRDLRHLMGVPRGRAPRQQEARAGMQQGEQVRHRAPPPRALPAGWAKGRVQVRRIGQRATGAIDEEGTVPQPPPLVGRRLFAPCGGLTPQRLPDDEREPRAGLTTGGGWQALPGPRG